MLKEKLMERRLPELLVMNDGRAVRNIDDWPARRRELIGLLSRE